MRKNTASTANFYIFYSESFLNSFFKNKKRIAEGRDDVSDVMDIIEEISVHDNSDDSVGVLPTKKQDDVEVVEKVCPLFSLFCVR